MEKKYRWLLGPGSVFSFLLSHHHGHLIDTLNEGEIKMGNVRRGRASGEGRLNSISTAGAWGEG